MSVCERFGCLPDRLYEQDASFLLSLQIEALGRPPDEKGEVVDGV